MALGRAAGIAETANVADDWSNRVARGNRAQFRLRFTRNVSADSANDYAGFDSGEFTPQTSAPRLNITYDYP